MKRCLMSLVVTVLMGSGTSAISTEKSLSAQAMIKKAWPLLNRGDKAKAQEMIQNIGENLSVDAHMEAGLLFHKLNQQKKAAHHFNFILGKLNLKSKQALLPLEEKLKKAIVIIGLGKLKEGMALALSAIDSKDSSNNLCGSFIQSGEFLLKLGHHSLATRFLLKVVSKYSTNKCIYLSIAEMARKHNLKKLLLQTVDKGLKLWPEDVSLLGFKATYAKMINNREMAIKLLEKVALTGKAHPSRLYELIALYMINEQTLRKKLHAYTKRARQFPADSSTAFIAGFLQFNKNNHELAIQFLKRALLGMPESKYIYIPLAISQFCTNNLRDAMKAVKNAITFIRDDYLALYYSGIIVWKKNKALGNRFLQKYLKLTKGKNNSHEEFRTQAERMLAGKPGYVYYDLCGKARPDNSRAKNTKYIPFVLHRFLIFGGIFLLLMSIVFVVRKYRK